MPHDPNEKHLEDNQKGSIEDLKVNAVDLSDIVNDSDDPRNGLPRFLSWERRKDINGEIYLQAITKDNKVIKLVVDEPPPPPKQYKVVIEDVVPEAVAAEPIEPPVKTKKSS